MVEDLFLGISEEVFHQGVVVAVAFAHDIDWTARHPAEDSIRRRAGIEARSQCTSGFCPPSTSMTSALRSEVL